MTPKSRGLALVLAVVVIATPAGVWAQPAEKKWRIGFLGVATASRFEPLVAALRLGLRDHGYVEGRNVSIEFRWAAGRYDRLPELAAELVRLDLDVLVTHGAPGTLALKAATSTTPIVMAIIGNPVEVGAVASLARPGGNITGSSFLSEEVTAKRLDILKAAIPGLTRVGVLTNPDNRAAPRALRTMERMAQPLSVTLQPVEVRRPEELEAALTIAKTHTEAVVVSDEQLFSVGDSPKIIADLAMRNRIPSAGFTTFADAGGLIGYGVDAPDIVRRSMALVDRILKGARPADLPIQQASKFEMVINLRTAKALGVAIPPSVLLRADRVIE